MKCPVCNHDVSEQAKFCPKCGSKILHQAVNTTSEQQNFSSGTGMQQDEECPYCHARVKANAKFCSKCGRSIERQEDDWEDEKKHGFGLVIAVIIAALICVFLVGTVAAMIFTDFIPNRKHSPLADKRESEITEYAESQETTGSSSENEKMDTEEVLTEKETVIESESEILTETETETETESETEAETESETEAKEHTYQLIAKDVSWTQAEAECRAMGGHLVTVTSEEEYRTLCSILKDSELMYIWAGARTGGSVRYWGDRNCWITGEEWSYDLPWFPGEPSGQDTDGTVEDCLCLWKVQYGDQDIGWTFNDQRNDILADFSVVSGKIGYICEFE